jgi:type VI secretion system protein ImpA
MFSIAQLMIPISPESSCGEDIAFSREVDEIAQARLYDDPTLDQGEWVVDLKEADWGLVASRCAKLIESRSKDLRLAVWLAEALARTRGLRGLGDGYAVLAGLCEHYWDGLHPLGEEGDYDQRIGNLHWLLARTPELVRDIPLDASLLDDAEYCLAALMELEKAADLRLGRDGPGFTPAREAVQAAIGHIAPFRAEAGLHQAIQGDAGAEGSVAASGPLRERTQALAQLRQVADFFRRTEPHSPVAYLADKAAQWGDMPLHVWLRAVVKDPAALAGLEELLGSHQASK